MAMSPVLLRPRRRVPVSIDPTAPSGVTLTTAPREPTGVTLATAPLPPTGVGLTGSPGNLDSVEVFAPDSPTGLLLAAGPVPPSGVQLSAAPSSPTGVTLSTAPSSPTGVGLTGQPGTPTVEEVFVPDAPTGVTLAPQANTDPYFSDVVLLLQDSLVDQSLNGSTVTAIGTTTLTTSAKVGSHAINLPTNTDRIEAISGPIGTSDYTVEFWLYLTELPTGTSGTAARPIFEANPDVTDAAAPNSCFGLRVELANGSYRLRAYRHTTAADIYGPLPSSGLNTWRHVAICRDGTSTRLYADGVEVGYGTSQNGLDWTSTKLVFAAGETGTGAWGAKCVMDEIRVTIGTARYTANFTPPTQAFPN